jgi:predicted helicase
MIMQNEITQYIAELNSIYRAGNATEHTYRPALKRFLENINPDLTVTNEPKRIDCGAPDYIVTRGEIPVGYIEAKDIGVDLQSKTNKEQFDRYRQSLDNLIITDYLTFQLFEGENFVAEISIAKILPNKITPVPENFNTFAEIIKTFSQYSGKVIKDSGKLAEYMAAKTQLLAEVIEKTISDKDENNSLRQQLKGFQEVLLPTMTDTQFSDIYAQTIAYGMFVARMQDEAKDNFTRQKAENLIPKSNPFLRNLFHYIAYDLDENIRWIVDSLADMFNYVDADAIHKEFVSKDKDPFLHFYEDFLTKYDKKLKAARGAYYTPLAVVKFIVQAVDDILKINFGIADGLADRSKVGEYHKVHILDPATGTGTFLAEVVRKIYQRFANNAGMWNDYVKQHLIPRLNGFEIMMSPYTMAHLKMGMILQELGYDSNDRLHIYLTDALENPKQNIQQIPFAQWLSNEAIEAAKIKNNIPIMVVLGNPPYSGESQNKGEWIMKLMDDYKKEPSGGQLQEKNPKWINDDYVKFIRYGQYFVEKNGEGVLAYINNHSFLDNPTFRGMRYNLLKTFDTIYILDLHGNAKKKETAPDGGKDENVFDIQQGVSINIFVKNRTATAKMHGGASLQQHARVFHYDLYGKRAEKYSFLLNNNLQTVEWKELKLTAPQYFFVTKDFSLQKEYDKSFSVQELFPVNSVGVVTARDAVFVNSNRDDLIKNIKAHFNIVPDETLIREISYRPFDIQYIYYDVSKIERARKKVMRHFLKGENVGLMVCRQQKTDGYYHCLIHENIVESSYVSNKTSEIGYVFPLYLYQENFGVIEKVANLKKEIVDEIAKRTGLRFTEDVETHGRASLRPIDILDYVYAVLHSPEYRERYREFLKIGFPRIPYPQDAVQFWTLATLGAKLRKLHLIENAAPLENVATYPISGDNKVEKREYINNKVYINDTQYFDHVPSVAWNFYIGGYQPAQKWLKDRKGRTLGYEDIVHYQRIIAILCETNEIMREIDEKIIHKI